MKFACIPHNEHVSKAQASSICNIKQLSLLLCSISLPNEQNDSLCARVSISISGKFPKNTLPLYKQTLIASFQKHCNLFFFLSLCGILNRVKNNNLNAINVKLDDKIHIMYHERQCIRDADSVSGDEWRERAKGTYLCDLRTLWCPGTMSGQAYIADSCWLMCESPQLSFPDSPSAEHHEGGDNTPAGTSSTTQTHLMHACTTNICQCNTYRSLGDCGGMCYNSL